MKGIFMKDIQASVEHFSRPSPTSSCRQLQGECKMLTRLVFFASAVDVEKVLELHWRQKEASDLGHDHHLQQGREASGGGDLSGMSS